MKSMYKAFVITLAITLSSCCDDTKQITNSAQTGSNLLDISNVSVQLVEGALDIIRFDITGETQRRYLISGISVTQVWKKETITFVESVLPTNFFSSARENYYGGRIQITNDFEENSPFYQITTFFVDSLGGIHEKTHQ